MKPHSPSTVRIAQILIVVVVLLACTLGLLIWQKVAGKDASQKDTSTSEHDSTDASTSDSSLLEANRRKSRNAQRKNDVSRLMTAVLEYSANNNGALPAMVFENQLRSESLDDTPTDLPALSSYPDSISIATGEAEAVDSDKLILVLQAVCSPDNGATAGTSRSFAVVYGLENSDGTYGSACEAS